jgi:hypothetical protein
MFIFWIKQYNLLKKENVMTTRIYPLQAQNKFFSCTNSASPIAQVCKSWSRNLCRYMCIEMQSLSPHLHTEILKIQKQIVSVPETDPQFLSQSFRVFRHLADELSQELMNLDEESFRGISRLFKSSLSVMRFQCMRTEILSLKAYPAMWGAILNKDGSFVTPNGAKGIRDTLQVYQESHLAERVFEQISTLDLSELGIRDLPKELALFTQVTSLYVQGNHFQDLSNLEKLPNLTFLDIMNSIPEDRAVELAEQIADQPQIKDVVAHDDYPALESSLLKSHVLKLVWKEVREGTNLPMLLRRSQIMQGFEQFQPTLARIQRVSFAHLRLPYFPEELLALRGLTELDLLDNDLTDLPDGFVNFRMLKVLILDQNPLDRSKQKRLQTMFAKMMYLNVIHFSAFSLEPPPATLGDKNKSNSKTCVIL